MPVLSGIFYAHERKRKSVNPSATPNGVVSLDAIILSSLRAISEAMGLPELPQTIVNARMEVFNVNTPEFNSFLIYLAYRHEKEDGYDFGKVVDDWCELVGSDLLKRTLRDRSRAYFYKCILGKKKPDNVNTNGVFQASRRLNRAMGIKRSKHGYVSL